jgi:hypothetical protein
MPDKAGLTSPVGTKCKTAGFQPLPLETSTHFQPDGKCILMAGKLFHAGFIPQNTATASLA